MTDQKIRLQCLAIAKDACKTSFGTIEYAKRLYEWVTTGQTNDLNITANIKGEELLKMVNREQTPRDR